MLKGWRFRPVCMLICNNVESGFRGPDPPFFNHFGDTWRWYWWLEAVYAENVCTCVLCWGVLTVYVPLQQLYHLSLHLSICDVRGQGVKSPEIYREARRTEKWQKWLIFYFFVLNIWFLLKCSDIFWKLMNEF